MSRHLLQDLESEPTMSQHQVSLAAMFLFTALAALTVVVIQQLSTYWLLIFGGCIVCLRRPSWSEASPLALALVYMSIAFAFTCGLACWFQVPAIQAIVPCAIFPGVAYIVGFVKGMENA